jgi:hypothetical protein
MRLKKTEGTAPSSSLNRLTPNGETVIPSETSIRKQNSKINDHQNLQGSTRRGPELQPTQTPLSKVLFHGKKQFWANFAAGVTRVPAVKVTAPGDERLPIGTIGDQIVGAKGIELAYPTALPRSDHWPIKNFAFAAVRWLNTFMSLRQKDLPSVAPGDVANDPVTAKLAQRGIAPPRMPQEIIDRPLEAIGAMALKGPFASYIEKAPGSDTTYQIDMSWMSQYPVQAGLAALGFRAKFEYDADEARMVPTSIEYQGKTINRDDADWEFAHRAALATMSTAMVAVRHLGEVHMVMGGLMTGLNTHLPKEHPIRLLMHPHSTATLGANMEISNLIESSASTFPHIFSFDADTVKRMISDRIRDFDLSVMDPVKSAANRGMDSQVKYPYLENVGAIHEVIAKYVSSFVDQYYPTEQSVQNDAHLKNWYDELNRYIPNGVQNHAGAFSKEAVKKLVTAYIYAAAVEHENVGNISYDYTTDQGYVPAKVGAYGELPNTGDQARFQFVNVVTFGNLNKLVDLPTLFPMKDADARRITESFRDDLIALDDRMRNEPHDAATLFPRNLEISIQA